MNINKEQVIIYSPKVAKGLIRRGFRVIDIAQNNVDPARTVFFFYKTGEILDILENEYDIFIEP